MQRLDYRNVRFSARVVNRGREQRKEIVNMNEVRAMAIEELFKAAIPAPRPDTIECISDFLADRIRINILFNYGRDIPTVLRQ